MANSRKPVSRRGILRGSAIAVTGLLATGGVTYGAMAVDRGPKGGAAGGPKVFEHGNRVHVGADSAVQGAPNEKAFDNIDGVPIMYIRNDEGERVPATNYCTFNFFDTGLLPWVQRLRKLSKEAGYADLEFITTAGAYVDKPGEHGKGQAVDIDEIAWKDGTMCRPIGKEWGSDDEALRKRYYALDCTARTYMRYTLDWGYNAEHHDHIHADFGGLPIRLLKDSETDTAFIKVLCNEFLGSGLPVDHVWDAATQAAFDEAVAKLGTTGDPHTDTEAYRAFLDAAAMKGFKGENF